MHKMCTAREQLVNSYKSNDINGLGGFSRFSPAPFFFFFLEDILKEKKKKKSPDLKARSGL